MPISSLRRKRRKREGTASLKEVTKLIDELRADIVSKEEVKQLIYESMHTNLPQKELSDSNIWSIRQLFTVSYLDGLRELTDVNLHRILRAVWLLILFVNLVLLALQMKPIVKDYLDEATVTKVGQIETDMSQLNRPSICLKLFKDFLHQESENSLWDKLHPVNNDSLLYLGYIKAMMPLFASSGLWLSHTTTENLTWSQFESIPARSSTSILYEEASLLSQNALYDLLYYWGIGETNLTTFEPSKFHYNTTFYSEILMRVRMASVELFMSDSDICFPMHLEEYIWVPVNGKQDLQFIYQHFATAERSNLSLVQQMSFQTHHFNIKTYSIRDSYPYSNLEGAYRYKFDYTNYVVIPTKYIHLNLTRQPCYDAFGEIYPRGFGEFICFQDCLWNNHAILFNCSFWEDMNPQEQQNINVCHVFDIFHQLRSSMSHMCKNNQNQPWCDDKTIRSVEEWSQILMQTYRELVMEKAYSIGGCQSKCVNFTFCEEWELDYELMYKHDLMELINDTIGPKSKAGLIASRIYRLSPFVSVNEDVLKASQAEFMSNLGGIIGFYFGASICGYLHFLLFLFISCCRTVTKMVNKLCSGDGRPTEE